jgi:hypothetical protein
MPNDFQELLKEKYPFLTLLRYATTEYVGIVQNSDDIITTLYDFGSITDADLKRSFVELANVWWWESNRSIPINIFLKQDWEIFRPFLKTFINKDIQVLLGPVTSLNDIARKKIKRKSITLVKRLD